MMTPEITSPTSLLQFLSHPVGPLPPWLRAQLAKVAADQPGIGGATWRRVMDDCIEEAVKRSAPDDSDKA